MSPFDSLQMPRELACEFFAMFSRFEFALKECGFLYVNRFGRAAPDWDGYSKHAAVHIKVDNDSELAEAIRYLNKEPPQIQVSATVWDATIGLRGPEPIGTALDAVQRVRNNLFHGGKHTPHSPPGRDEKLVRFALCVLGSCLSQDHRLCEAYEQPAAF